MYKLRQALLPYTYTAARRTHDTGLGIVLPPYYEHPELDDAYQNSHSYYFGPQLFVNPITAPVTPATQLTTWPVWLPPGVWVNMFTGAVAVGPETTQGQWTLAEVPAYARAGSIIPMLVDASPALGQAEVTPRALRLMAYVGGAMRGWGQVYDDAGVGLGYQKGEGEGGWSYTNFTYEVTGTRVEVVVGAASAEWEGQVTARSYELWLVGVLPATGVTVGGKALRYAPYLGLSRAFAGEPPLPDEFSYDGTTLAVVVNVRTPVSVKTGTTIVVDLMGAVDSPVLREANGLQGIVQRYITAKVALDDEWGKSSQVYMDDYPQLLRVAQMGERLTNAPHNATQLLGEWLQLVKGACAEIGGIYRLRPELKVQLQAQLCPSQAAAVEEGSKAREAAVQ